MEIARIALHVSAPPGVRIVEENAELAPFLSTEPGLAQHQDWPVELRLDRPPDTSTLALLFEAEGWRAYRDGTDVVLEFRLDGSCPGVAADESSILWTARLPPESGRPVVVHPGRPLVHRRDGVTIVQNPLSYPLDQLVMMHLLPIHRGLLVHAAGIRRPGGAIVFPGRSGAGKSTLMRLLSDRGDVKRLSDDRMVIRLTEGGAMAFGTPWAGNERVAANDGDELRALAFLRQSPEHRLVRLDPREALHRLLPMTSILWHDAERSTAALEACATLVERVPAYDLYFRRDAGVHAVLSDLA